MEGDPTSLNRIQSSAYEEALNCLSSLITKRQRGGGGRFGWTFDRMEQYVKKLGLEDRIEKLKVIHVAGTKGKGSTCTFAETILRSCGYRTGLFTSPHLIDIRERFKLDGAEITEEKFLRYFWWCWHRFQEKTDEENGPDEERMPSLFRFLALLAFKIFAEEQVDVAVIEVGLGGRFDATNVVKRPVVCGVSSLGFDHMETLGNTLGEIATSKAGIFKEYVPAFTAPQPDEAMVALEKRAEELGIPLAVVQPLDTRLLKGQKLGLDGEHQYLNAGLAVALCRAWLKKAGGGVEGMDLADSSMLPEQFIRGLTTASLAGRAQIVPDLQHSEKQNQESCDLGELVFYLDGAHTPESMEVCGRWFSQAVKNGKQAKIHSAQSSTNGGFHCSEQILLFNCMPVRDPEMLLPKLVNACSANGIHFRKAIFVPDQSLYYKVGSYAAPANDSPVEDLSWQKTIQRVWEDLVGGEKGSSGNCLSNGHARSTATDRSRVFSSLPSAIKWLRDRAMEDGSVCLQVLVTGSVHLVGDVLRIINK